ncbi:DUF4185 domain-containing protein [Chelativorans sp. EGI FJ00035]|uniref:DUF4185 domain-containing protein n=2 Tax=Chelativorans salis TaxID=2978478 RepID=A0ABT2LHI4_9HYPH|nr:DUF4185 domain-containing protein [Chelativorans sp. EGI FJ00035]
MEMQDASLQPDVKTGDQAAVSPLMVHIAGSEVVSQVTGRDAVNDTARRWDVHGTDLGHMFLHNDALYMVFGDTFGQRSVFGLKNWRSNTIARIADPDPRNGLPIETMITGANGAAKELLHSRKIGGIEKTVIPTNGISIGSRMYLHYMSVKRWGEPGRWDVRHSGIAFSDDDGHTWEVPPEAVQNQAIGFEQVAFVRDEDTLYTFGIPEGRFGGVRLRRVAAEQILARDAYEYWTGTEWVADPAAASLIVPAPVGELSVAWSKAHQSWVMMYFDPERKAIVLRLARDMTGPWGEAQVVVGAQDYPGLYAPYIVPGSDIDTELYYTMSQWTPYNVFLMRTTLEWPAPAIAAVPEAPSEDG